MKKQVLYCLILILPFLGMIIINEYVRANTYEQGFTKYGVTAINSGEGFKHKCSFICHKAKKNYSKSKYDYLISKLKLKQSIGTLSIDDLKVVNSWLN